MATVFYLRNYFERGSGREVLNHKNLIVKECDNHLVFYDAVTYTPLWQTTSIVEKIDTGRGVIVTTRSGAKYELMKVCLNYDPKREIPEPINTRREYKGINYGDGYTRYTYTFPEGQTLTEDEFKAFLIRNEKCLYPSPADSDWWEDDYSVTRSGAKWVYEITHKYTD